MRNYVPFALSLLTGAGFFGAGFSFVADFSLGVGFTLVAALSFVGAFGAGFSFVSTLAFLRPVVVGFSSAISSAFRFGADLLAVCAPKQCVRTKSGHHE